VTFSTEEQALAAIEQLNETAVLGQVRRGLPILALPMHLPLERLPWPRAVSAHLPPRAATSTPVCVPLLAVSCSRGRRALSPGRVASHSSSSSPRGCTRGRRTASSTSPACPSTSCALHPTSRPPLPSLTLSPHPATPLSPPPRLAPAPAPARPLLHSPASPPPPPRPSSGGVDAQRVLRVLRRGAARADAAEG